MNSKSAAAAVGSKQSAESNLTTFRRTFTIIAVFNLVEYSPTLIILILIVLFKLFVIERTVFDFMGFMYGIIAADLIFLVFLIIGIFGAYQYRANYVVTVISRFGQSHKLRLNYSFYIDGPFIVTLDRLEFVNHL